MKSSLNIKISGHLLVKDITNNKILVNEFNSIHGQNAARIISKAFANETFNNYLYVLKFGNGGSFTDSAGNTVLRKKNDGNNGDNWESQLYNATYAKIIDESDINFGLNPFGGGATPTPGDSGVTSEEVGLKSNVIINITLNENEPTGQLSTDAISSPTGEEKQFIFDEIGLFTKGKPAQATNGISNVNVGNKLSTDEFPIQPNHVSTLTAIVDGISYTSQITTPPSGSGPNGVITFGDFCEGFNSGLWITGGDALNTLLYVFITDRSNLQYPSIIAKESFGLLAFQSKTVGSTSSVSLSCNDQISTNFFNILTSGVCGNVNVNQLAGENAGVQNDPLNPENERERLISHLIFPPITKSSNITLIFNYSLTISVNASQDSVISQEFTS